MIDLAVLLQVAGLAGLMLLSAILLHWLLADPVGPGLADLFRIPLDPPMPRGVREDEPIRWSVELLQRRRPSGRSRLDVSLGERTERREPASTGRCWPAPLSGQAGDGLGAYIEGL